MKDLQEYKTWLEDERSKAYDEMQNERGFDREEYNMFKGMYEALDLCIQKLNLLPNQQPNSEIAPPLQQAAVMRGEAEPLPCCSRCGLVKHPVLRFRCLDEECPDAKKQGNGA